MLNRCICATWWPNLQLMQVAPPVEQICNHCKYLHVVANIWKQWMRLHMAKLSSCKWQVAPSSGQICNQFKWRHLVNYEWSHIQLAIFETNASGILFSWRDLNSSFRCYTLGPLCLWQCFIFNTVIQQRCISGSEYAIWLTEAEFSIQELFIGHKNNLKLPNFENAKSSRASVGAKNCDFTKNHNFFSKLFQQ